MEPLLDPCPACGGTDTQTVQKPAEFGQPTRYRVVCDTCGHGGPYAPRGERARALWNAAARRDA